MWHTESGGRADHRFFATQKAASRAVGDDFPAIACAPACGLVATAICHRRRSNQSTYVATTIPTRIGATTSERKLDMDTPPFRG